MIVRMKKARPDSRLPYRATSGAAGFDIYADGDYDLRPGAMMLVPGGFHVAIPRGWCGQIWPRSGWATKFGIDRLAGLIDSDYRGEVHVSLINHGDQLVEIRKGDRIAQIVFSPCLTSAVETDVLDDTERGSGGFGSTGI